MVKRQFKIELPFSFYQLYFMDEENTLKNIPFNEVHSIFSSLIQPINATFEKRVAKKAAAKLRGIKPEEDKEPRDRTPDVFLTKVHFSFQLYRIVLPKRKATLGLKRILYFFKQLFVPNFSFCLCVFPVAVTIAVTIAVAVTVAVAIGFFRFYTV